MRYLLIILLLPFAANSQTFIGPSNGWIRMGVGNVTNSIPAPQVGTILHLVSDTTINGRISFDTYNNTSFTGSNFQGRRARGTAASPTAAILDDILSAYGADGYGADSYTGSSVGSMNIRANETFTNTSKPTYISFTTTPSASITQVERLRIKPDGIVQITGLNAVGFMQTDASGNVSSPDAATTKTSLSLNNVTNTSDANKPVSTAQQTALDLKANLASPTFTGTPTMPTGTIGVTQSAANSTTALATTAFVTTADNLKANIASPAFTGTPTGIGIPVYAQVTGSDVTTTGQALTNITGLSVALTTNATYEFEAVMSVSTSAVTTGTAYGINYSVAGGAIEAQITGASTSTASKTLRINALNTATTLYLATSAQTGGVVIKGRVTTGANAGNLTVSHLKLTSGTSTIFIGSFLKVTRIL